MKKIRSLIATAFLFQALSTNGAKNARIVNDVSLNLFLGIWHFVNCYGIFMLL